MKKFPNSKIQIPKSEAGVTLLLAVLLMSGLIIITVTVADLGISEFRLSRAYIFTEPAIGAAQSGTETALWALKRSNTTTISSNCSSPSMGSVTGSIAKNSYCKNTSTDAIFNVEAGIPYVFYLFDASTSTSRNVDIDLKGMSPTYQEMTVNYINGTTPVTVTVTRLDGTSVGFSNTPVSFSSGSETITGLDSGIAGADNRMQVRLEASRNLTVTINTNAGLPSFPTLDSTGCSGPQISTSSCNSLNDIYARRLQVTVPQ